MDLLRELFTPSNQTGPADRAYRRSAEGVYHAVLGAGLISAFSLFDIHIGPLLASLLYAPKELIDWLNGGSLSDSIEDTLCVFIGAALVTFTFWPLGLLALGVILMVLEHGRPEQ